MELKFRTVTCCEWFTPGLKSDIWKFTMMTSLSVEDDVRVHIVRFNSRRFIGLYQVCG